MKPETTEVKKRRKTTRKPAVKKEAVLIETTQTIQDVVKSINVLSSKLERFEKDVETSYTLINSKINLGIAVAVGVVAALLAQLLGLV